jgi:outer membrane protein, heavy metal efflux system
MKFLLFILTLISTDVLAQVTIDSVLSSIGRNNKTLISQNQLTVLQKTQFRVGMNPANPTVEYDYLSGSRPEAGNQKDFTIVQTFDFPTTYTRKKQLALEQMKSADHTLTSVRQDILLSAKQICIQLIYRRRLQKYLDEQKQFSLRIRNDFSTRMEKGEGNILDLNKARLQLADINNLFAENLSAIEVLTHRLTELNGGNELNFSDTSFSQVDELPEFKELETAYELADPVRKSLEQEVEIAKKQVQLSRAMWLPKFQAGYHYQAILSESFSGFHSGITLPLWENRNTVKLQKHALRLSELKLDEHKTEHFYQLKQLYAEYTSLRNQLSEYKAVLDSADNFRLLAKALQSGHISSIDYFAEVRIFHFAYQNYLLLESKYYAVIAELNKYRL